MKRDPEAALKRKHVERVAQMPCIVPGCRHQAVIHHIMHMPRPLAVKSTRRDDRYIAPLCPDHHNMGNESVHLLGGEAKFDDVHAIDLPGWAVREWEKSRATF